MGERFQVILDRVSVGAGCFRCFGNGDPPALTAQWASPDRARIVPWTGAATANERDEAAATDRQRAMSWAQRLRRVFAIDIETCRQCGGPLRVIASIEAPAVIERILEHRGRDAGSVDPAYLSRAPPERDTSL